MVDLDNLAAYHEAAHAVIAHALGRNIHSIAIDPGGHGGGEFQSAPTPVWAEGDAAQARLLTAVTAGLEPSDEARRFWRTSLIERAAGRSAQWRLLGTSAGQFDHLCCYDDEQITSVARAITASSAEAREYVAAIRFEVDQLVDQHWRKITFVAEALLYTGRLDRLAIEAALNRAELGPGARRRFYWEHIEQGAKEFEARWGALSPIEV